MTRDYKAQGGTDKASAACYAVDVPPVPEEPEGWRDVVEDTAAAFFLCIAGLAIPMMLVASLFLPERFVGWLVLGMISLSVLIAAITAYGSRRRRVESRRTRTGLCVKCGYDLRGNERSTHCPECGRAISPKARKYVQSLDG